MSRNEHKYSGDVFVCERHGMTLKNGLLSSMKKNHRQVLLLSSDCEKRKNELIKIVLKN